MHDEIRGLTGVDARGIDPQRADPPLLDQKTRGFLTVGRKVQVRGIARGVVS